MLAAELSNPLKPARLFCVKYLLWEEWGSFVRASGSFVLLLRATICSMRTSFALPCLPVDPSRSKSWPQRTRIAADSEVFRRLSAGRSSGWVEGVTSKGPRKDL